MERRRASWKIGRVEFEAVFMPNSWSLPVSFGGGIWVDEEVGDYGTVYSCEYYRHIIIGILCVWLNFTWMLHE